MTYAKNSEEYLAKICGMCGSDEPQTTEFEITCRHGAVFFACAYHLLDQMKNAFERDGRDGLHIEKVES